MRIFSSEKYPMQELHLKFIESTIERLSGFSAQVKRWGLSVEIATVTFVLKFRHEYLFSCRMGGNATRTLHFAAKLFWIPFTVVLPFLLLDIYYLYLERGYRDLYEDIIKGNKDVANCSMILPKRFRGRKKYLCTLFSVTGLFYLGSIMLMVIYMWLILA